jgi:hypothetical protein
MEKPTTKLSAQDRVILFCVATGIDRGSVHITDHAMQKPADFPILRARIGVLLPWREQAMCVLRASGRGKIKRAAGVVRVRRLVLAPRGLTGLLNPCVRSGTKLFQPYFMNCFNCVSPAAAIRTWSAG